MSKSIDRSYNILPFLWWVIFLSCLLNDGPSWKILNYAIFFYQACDRCNSNPNRHDWVLNLRQPYQPKGMMFMCPKMGIEFEFWKSFITHKKVPNIRSIFTRINMQGLECTSHLTRAILSNTPMICRLE